MTTCSVLFAGCREAARVRRVHRLEPELREGVVRGSIRRRSSVRRRVLRGGHGRAQAVAAHQARPVRAEHTHDYPPSHSNTESPPNYHPILTNLPPPTQFLHHEDPEGPCLYDGRTPEFDGEFLFIPVWAIRLTCCFVYSSMRHQHLLHHVRRVAAATGEPLQAVRLLHGTFRSPLPGARYVYFITHFNLTYGQLYRRRVLFVFTGTCIAAKNMRWFATFLMYAGVSQNHIQDPNTNTQLPTN